MLSVCGVVGDFSQLRACVAVARVLDRRTLFPLLRCVTRWRVMQECDGKDSTPLTCEIYQCTRSQTVRYHASPQVMLPVRGAVTDCCCST